MQKLIIVFLISLLFLAGCVTPQPETRYYQSYNKPPNFDSYIQGNGYKLWYSEDHQKRFVELAKEAPEWQSMQKQMGSALLEHVFIDRVRGFYIVIAKNRYKTSYDKILQRAKKSSEATLIESDQRMVNSIPVLYVRMLVKIDINKAIACLYWINTDSGILLFGILCPEDEYGENREMIQHALNGIVIE